MYDEQAKVLGLRAVACPGWRWLPGMLARWNRPPNAGGQQVLPTEARVADLPTGPLSLMFCLVDPASVYPGSWPDFRDAATLGCLLALVREAWDDPWLHVENWEHGWVAMGQTEAMSGDLTAMCHTEAEALVAALEAAPARAHHESENA